MENVWFSNNEGKQYQVRLYLNRKTGGYLRYYIVDENEKKHFVKIDKTKKYKLGDTIEAEKLTHFLGDKFYITTIL